MIPGIDHDHVGLYRQAIDMGLVYDEIVAMQKQRPLWVTVFGPYIKKAEADILDGKFPRPPSPGEAASTFWELAMSVVRGEVVCLTADQFAEWMPHAAGHAARWQERGDGVAVYRNIDLSSARRGATLAISYGSGASNCPTEGDPPVDLPISYPTQWAWKLCALVPRP